MPGTTNIDQSLDASDVSLFTLYLRQIVYGGSDGIVTTFAVVAGFSGANIDPSMSSLPVLTVLLFGFANLFADATSMGLGNFLSVRADNDVYRQENAIIKSKLIQDPGTYIEISARLLETKGFNKEESAAIAHIYSRNTHYWADFMSRNLLNMTDSINEKAFQTSLATFLAFISFGSIPLIPYIFFHVSVSAQFLYSIVSAGVALILLGIFRWKVSKRNVFLSVLETLLIGGTSAVVAYCVGFMFQLG